MRKYLNPLMLGAAMFLSQSAVASAADLGHQIPLPPAPPPPPVVAPPPPPIPVPEPRGKFYLRGTIGMTNQEIDTFTNTVIEAGDFTIIHHDFDSSPIWGFGVGVIHSERFRFDVTGEFRGHSNFRGLDTYVDVNCGPGVCTNQHTGIKSEWLFLANAYWDIGTFRGITPYVGAGIGAAKVMLDDFWDQNLVTNGLYWAEENDEWNFAWAIHAGVTYSFKSNLHLDVGYRYTNMGDGKTGLYYTYDPAAAQPLGETTLKDIESHDLLVSLRFDFGGGGCCAPVAHPPVAYK